MRWEKRSRTVEMLCSWRCWKEWPYEEANCRLHLFVFPTAEKEAAMPEPPTGTVTLLFTDIAGSTKLWQEHPQLMPLALARHDAILRQAIEAANGFVVKTVGDAFMAVFPTATGRTSGGIDGTTRPLLLNPGLPLCRCGFGWDCIPECTEERDNDYYGHEVNRAARIQAVGHPQQIVLSHSVYEGVKESLPDTVTLLDLGLHQLKDLNEPEALWQLCHPDLPATFPPLNSLSHWPNNLPRQTSSFIGREAQIEEGATIAGARSLPDPGGIRWLRQDPTGFADRSGGVAGLSEWSVAGGVGGPHRTEPGGLFRRQCPGPARTAGQDDDADPH